MIRRPRSGRSGSWRCQNSGSVTVRGRGVAGGSASSTPQNPRKLPVDTQIVRGVDPDAGEWPGALREAMERDRQEPNMSDRALYCHDYVNQPYPRVRDVLLTDPHYVFRHATAAAANDTAA